MLLQNVHLILRFAWELSCKCSPTRSVCSQKVIARFVSIRAAPMMHKCVIVVAVVGEKVIGDTKVNFGVTESSEWCSAG